MKTVFADAGYWIAILNPADALRAKAATLSNALDPFQIVTSEMVFTEVLNSFLQTRKCLQTSCGSIRQAIDR